jgi:hypothetical protein
MKRTVMGEWDEGSHTSIAEHIDDFEEARYQEWLNDKDEQLTRLEYLNALPNSMPSGWHG